MKITRLLFYTGLALMIIVGAMAVSQSHAAQTPVGTITTPSTGQTTLKAYNDSYVNPKLTIIGGNFDDIATGKADASCFATESAFNACFDLTWAAGGTSVTDATITTTDVTTNNASTTKHGWAVKATAPASGLRNIVAIDNGETAYTNKALFDATSPATQALGDTAVVGTAMTAARRDHKHAMPVAQTATTTAFTPEGSIAATTVQAAIQEVRDEAASGSMTVCDGTAGPFLDGTSDGGTLIKLYGPGGCWQALQAGNSVANRSWRLPIGAPPSAGTTTLLNVDEYGQIGQVATSTYLTPTGSAANLTSFPTLNQNTTGSAATLTTARTIGGTSFNGSANIDISYANLTNKPTIPTASDTAYDATSWNGNTDVPTKNAVRDKIETLGSAFDPAAPGAIGGTTPAAITGTTITGSSFVSSSADGTHYANLVNGVAISSTPTLGLIGYYNGRMRLADGADWDGYFLEDTDLGTGVGTMLAIAPGSAGGPTTTVVSGTSALGTGAISSGACASVVTTSATGTATTDVINWGFNSSPAAVTGYVASADGMLTIIAYPSSGNVNFLVCNNTAASITPGAVTLNWRIQR